MSIKKTLVHFNHIALTLSADELKAALIAKYGDVLAEGVILQGASYSAYRPDEGVEFTFAESLEGHNT
ncbi:hypothetical protein [Pseudomonas lundensis]|uniref:hypothetical protein n=1 Tax=Pseudomonas lundensis TaxID=86185 RepID=UPI000BA2B4E2|nr:hypothetical protein [Pseudomonas lundensis]OZY47973.1 hypothetical protein CJF41_00605 [Pseudomonas lundensis]